MISPENLEKLERIANHTRQSTRMRNDADSFVREVLKRAKEGRIHDEVAPEYIEAIAAEQWIQPLIKSRAEYPLNILEVAAQRRNHKLMLKLLRHPNDDMRINAAEQFQILFAMLDGYYDEASSLVNQILLNAAEIPAVKYALLRDLGRSSRRGQPSGIGDTARRLINDIDQGVSYHALRLLSYLYDVRDWKTVLDRMVTLVGEEEEAAEYFLLAGFDYLQILIPHEPTVLEWVKSLIENYPPQHNVVQSIQGYVRRNPDAALQVGLINRREHRELTGS